MLSDAPRDDAPRPPGEEARGDAGPAPPPEVAVSARDRLAARCVYCHDDVAGEPAAWTCRACGARLHLECVQDLGRCPTIGCAVLAPRPAVEVEVASVAPDPEEAAAEDRRVARRAATLFVVPSALAVFVTFASSGLFERATLGVIALALLLLAPLGWWLVASAVSRAIEPANQARARIGEAPALRASVDPTTGATRGEPPHPPWRVEPPASPRPAVDDEPAPPWTARRPPADDEDRPRAPWRVDGV